MKLNNIPLQSYRAEIVDFAPTTLDINNNIIVSDSIIPMLGKQVLKPSVRELIVDFIDELDISNFTVELSTESILDINDDFIYKVWLAATPSISKEGISAFTVTYSLYTLKYSNQISISEKTYTNPGNVKSPCVISVLSDVDVAECIINGLIIYNLKANKELLINGIDKVIHYVETPDVSEFDNVDLFNFPMVVPGVNTIVSDNEDILITISFNPTYL